MKGPVVLVAVTLAGAIVLTILLLFASSAGSGNDPRRTCRACGMRRPMAVGLWTTPPVMAA